MDDLTQKIPATLLDELEKALQSVSYGSIEIYVQNKVVTQITVRNIKKTSVGISRTITQKTNSKIHSRIDDNSKVQIKMRP